MVTPEGLLVRIKFSKTMQAGQEQVLIPISKFPGSPLCPRATFILMSKLIPALPQSPAFSIPTPQGLCSISYDQFVRGLRLALGRAGVCPTGYAGHSFRRGSSSWAFAQGVPADLIQKHGLWRSDVYKIYLEMSLDTKLSVTRAMAPSVYKLVNG